MYLDTRWLALPKNLCSHASQQAGHIMELRVFGLPVIWIITIQQITFWLKLTLQSVSHTNGFPLQPPVLSATSCYFPCNATLLAYIQGTKPSFRSHSGSGFAIRCIWEKGEGIGGLQQPTRTLLVAEMRVTLKPASL